MGLTFLSPLFLLGAATAAIPIILHLVHHQKSHPVPFGTLMFLQQAVRRTARRRRLHELIMLLLRCAMLVALALAFAGPVLSRTGIAGEKTVHAVLVIDDSFSMRYRHDGSTSFDRAREGALTVLDALPDGSEAALLFTGGNQAWEVPSFSPNLLEVRQGVQSAEPTAMASSVPPAAARARAALSERAVLGLEVWPNREFYIFTDLQKNAWTLSEAGSARPEDMPDVRMTVVDCGSAKPENVAVSGLVTGRGTADASAGVSLRADVHNFGTRSQEVAVSLRAASALGEPDSQLKGAETVTVPGGGTTRVSFSEPLGSSSHEPLTDSSEVTGHVAVPPDALPLDDTRYFAVAGSTSTRVLVLGQDDPGNPGSSLFYVHTALTVPSSPFEAFAVSPGELPSMRLDGVGVIVAGAMGGPGWPVADALRDFVRRGGGLILFLGPEVSPAEYNRTLGQSDADGAALLPAPVSGIVASPDDERLTWTDVDLGHPMFDSFAGLGADELGFVRTSRYLALEDAGSRMRVLARYSDGGVAIAEGLFGNGRVLLFTTSCDTSWSNLPLRSSFVPILYRAVTYAAGRREASVDDHGVGQPIEFVFPVENGKVSLEVVSPDRSNHVVVTEPTDTENRATFSDTDLPGLYVVHGMPVPEWAESAEPGGARAIAVNVDTAESDLDRLSEQRLAQLLPGAQVSSSAGVGRTVQALAHGGSSMLWGTLIALLVGASLVESVLASFFTPGRSEPGVRARSLDVAVGADTSTRGGGRHA